MENPKFDFGCEPVDAGKPETERLRAELLLAVEEPKRAAPVETWLWLANALGFASAHSAEILAQYENPQRLLEERFSVNLSSLFTPMQIEAARCKEPEDFAERVRLCAQMGVTIVCYEDAAYPRLLRQIPSPPPVLFCKGDVTLLNERVTFAMVGTRRPSAYGVEATRTIAKGLAQAGVVLVSGMATGLDSESHKAAIQAGTPTIACIAFGHDRCYPAENRSLKAVIERQGLVVSEYPPGTDSARVFFLQRNRIIAALSLGICVAEARKSSGTMNTVSAALAFGRDVFSVPGNIFSPLCEGTNLLLTEGAIPTVCAQNILTWYHLEPQVAARKNTRCIGRSVDAVPDMPILSPAARSVQGTLSHRAQTLPALCGATNLTPAAVMAALTELELAGISRQQAGRQFVLADTNSN